MSGSAQSWEPLEQGLGITPRSLPGEPRFLGTAPPGGCCLSAERFRLVCSPLPASPRWLSGGDRAGWLLRCPCLGWDTAEAALCLRHAPGTRQKALPCPQKCFLANCRRAKLLGGSPRLCVCVRHPGFPGCVAWAVWRGRQQLRVIQP